MKYLIILILFVGFLSGCNSESNKLGKEIKVKDGKISYTTGIRISINVDTTIGNIIFSGNTIREVDFYWQVPDNFPKDTSFSHVGGDEILEAMGFKKIYYSDKIKK